MTAAWCFKVENLKSRHGFSRPELMKRTPLNYWSLPFTLKRGAWSPEEDLQLVVYIKRSGIRNWNKMPKAAGKSCRLRWMNYLRPDIKLGNFSKEEVQTIIKLHELLGNRWSAIAAKLPGRTDNDIRAWSSIKNGDHQKSEGNAVRKGELHIPRLEIDDNTECSQELSGEKQKTHKISLLRSLNRAHNHSLVTVNWSCPSGTYKRIYTLLILLYQKLVTCRIL